jgi:hypothetical protein
MKRHLLTSQRVSASTPFSETAVRPPPSLALAKRFQRTNRASCSLLGFSVEQPASFGAGCSLKTKHSKAPCENVTDSGPSAENRKPSQTESAINVGQFTRSGWLSLSFWLLVVQWLFLSLPEKSTE